MEKLKHFQKFQSHYEVGTILLVLMLNALVNATTRLMDQSRISDVPNFQSWEPFVWEVSSLLSVCLLLPCVVWVSRSRYSNWSKPFKTIGFYALVSIPFSILHVLMMVAMRKLVYSMHAADYVFGNWWFELVYEYRKDAITFVYLLVIIHCYRFVWSRLQGEANLVSTGESQPVISSEQHAEQGPARFDYLLVKKLGKEFIVKVADIDWLEASGNYVNLHVGARVYPLRKTITALIDDLSAQGFCRIHRSYAVNLRVIESIEILPSGSGELTLKTNKVLSVSRKYYQVVKQRLS